MKTAEIIGISRHRILRDGDGVTTLVGINGCPFRCIYCINKEILCQSHQSQKLSVDQLLKIVEIDDLYFRATNGGITFGGGEPLLNAEFIKEFRSICPSHWKINIETTLNVHFRLLLDFDDLADNLIVDIKSLDSEIYNRYTGFNNNLLISNLSELSKRHLQDKVLIRVPLIPNYNDKNDVYSSIKKLKDLGFHKYRIVRYIDNTYRNLRQVTETEYGKGMCNILKHIRTIVAEANGVELKEYDCSKNKCRTGSCPKCEKELSFLSSELNKLSEQII